VASDISTKGELDDAIGWAQESGQLAVVEVKISRDDISPQLARIGLEVAKLRGWKVPAHCANDGRDAESFRRTKTGAAL
jgi:hypothetical protein